MQGLVQRASSIHRPAPWALAVHFPGWGRRALASNSQFHGQGDRRTLVGNLVLCKGLNGLQATRAALS
ncbi:MAG: hypothetical protein EBT08_04285 [Betaproteobacteria bacterium]|nr:hypothetical protein [Betaproteobacteria bacterium]